MAPRLGIVILPEHRWPEARPLWVAAEELGFAQAWTYDHLAWRTLADGPWFGTVPTLTAAATVTRRMRLGTMVVSPNYRHPVVFAKDAMTLDDVSGGRLTLGMGAGGVGVDAQVLGEAVLSPAARAARFEEFAVCLDLLLRQDVTDFEGASYRAVEARMLPGCLQRPRPPFVVAANGPRLMRLAARLGQGWVTTGATAPADGLERWWAGVAELAARFSEVLDAQGLPPDALARHLMVDSCGQPALTSEHFFADCLGRAEELGFTDMIVHWPRPDGIHAASRAVLEAVAPG